MYFTGGHNYTNSFGTGLPGSKIHVNRSNFTLGLQHAVSRRWALTAAANGIHRYGATVSCTHYGALFGVARSEERRVGKECRSRWSSDYYVKYIMNTYCRT